MPPGRDGTKCALAPHAPVPYRPPRRGAIAFDDDRRCDRDAYAFLMQDIANLSIVGIDERVGAWAGSVPSFAPGMGYGRPTRCRSPPA